jgi:CRISPR-associated protein Cas1
MDTKVKDLHALPKFRDSIGYLYVEHALIDREAYSITIWDENGSTPVPAVSLALLMLGPGTRITHGAMNTLADNNCLVCWCGEEGVRLYAASTGGTRSAANLLHQARLATDEKLRLEVVKRMYRMRFSGGDLDPALTVEQLRGMEGARVRAAYAEMSRQTGLEWGGRNYDRGNWNKTDAVNRALSCANACLYGLCHAAIVSIGYSPGLGFIHTGKQLSFVYDIADLYKADLTIPIAFEVATQNPDNLERTVRLRCRDVFRDHHLLARIVPDIQKTLATPTELIEEWFTPDADAALPTDLWTPSWEKEEVTPRPGDEQWGN